MTKRTIDLNVNDRGKPKYTVVYNEGDQFPQKALRYGEPWRNLVGDNLIFWLCEEIFDLREKLKSLENKEE